jgi:polyribonucleotide 5'-hydroxyl-kinase
MAKSSGVVERPQSLRITARSRRIHEYFYGQDDSLTPHLFEIKFSQMKGRIFKIICPAQPPNKAAGQNTSSNDQQQQKSAENRLELVDFSPKELTNHLLAVSFAKNENELMFSNVAGFICVTKVDSDSKKISILSPQPEPLPDENFFIVSEVQFVM